VVDGYDAKKPVFRCFEKKKPVPRLAVRFASRDNFLPCARRTATSFERNLNFAVIFIFRAPHEATNKLKKADPKLKKSRAQMEENRVQFDL
jgi:hypothetical protein